MDGISEVLAGLTSLTVDTGESHTVYRHLNISDGIYCVAVCDKGLDSIVSIIDCERLRRVVVKHKGGGGGGSSSELQMGYELFYDWLRLLAQLVFKEQGSQGAEASQGALTPGDRDKGHSGRRALHRLLTQYIIPYASKIGEGGLRSAAAVSTGDYVCTIHVSC